MGSWISCVAFADAVDIPQDQDPRHFLKRLPVIDRDRLVIQQEIAKGVVCMSTC